MAADNPIEDLTKSLLDEVCLEGNKLCWSRGQHKGKPVSVVQVQIKYGCEMESYAKAAVDIIQSKLQKSGASEKSESKESVVDISRQVTLAAKEFLRGRVFVAHMDNKPTLFLRAGPESRLVYFDTEPDLNKDTVLNTFLSQLRAEMNEQSGRSKKDEGEDSPYVKERKKLQAKLTALSEKLAASGSKAAGPTVPSAIKQALSGSILASEDETFLADAGFPIFAWDKPALCRLDIKRLDDDRETPLFDSFLDRVNNPEHLMAFVWKIFQDFDVTGREMVWGRSEGRAGQSTFWNTITSALPGVVAAIPKSSDTNEFTNFDFYMKRFAMCSDCPDPYMVNTKLVKNITGGDVVPINARYKAAFSGRIWARVVIHSNKYPVIDTTDVSIMSRLLLFRVKSIGETVADLEAHRKMKKELWSFLRKCRDAEARICGRYEPGPDGEDRSRDSLAIPIPKEMTEAIYTHCETRERRATKIFLDNRVKKSEGGVISEDKLWDEYRIFAKKILRYSGRIVDTRIDRERESIDQLLKASITASAGAWAAEVGHLAGNPNNQYLGVDFKEEGEEEELVL